MAALDKKVGSRVYTKKTDGDFRSPFGLHWSCGEATKRFRTMALRLLADKVVEPIT